MYDDYRHLIREQIFDKCLDSSTQLNGGPPAPPQRGRHRSPDGVRIGQVAHACASESRDKSARIRAVAPQRLDGGRRHRACQWVSGEICQALRHHLGRGGLQEPERVQTVLRGVPRWVVSPLLHLGDLGDEQRRRSGHTKTNHSRVSGLERDDLVDLVVHQRRFEACRAPRCAAAVDRQSRRTSTAPTAQRLGDHEIDGHAEAPAPCTRVRGELEAGASQGVFQQRLVQQRGGEDREVGIGSCRHDDQLSVARCR